MKTRRRRGGNSRRRRSTRDRRRRSTHRKRGGAILGKGSYGAIYYDSNNNTGLSCDDAGRIIKKPGVVSKIMLKGDEEYYDDEIKILKLINERFTEEEKIELEKYFLIPEKGCEIKSKDCNAENKYCEDDEQTTNCDTCDETRKKTGMQRLSFSMGEDAQYINEKQLTYSDARFIVLPKGEKDLKNYIDKDIIENNAGDEYLQTVFDKLKELEKGLELIHLKKIYHIDIKPANFLVIYNDDKTDYSIKFIDYGLIVYKSLTSEYWFGTDLQLLIWAYFPTNYWIFNNFDYYNDIINITEHGKFKKLLSTKISLNPPDGYLYNILTSINSWIIKKQDLVDKWLILIYQIFDGKLTLFELVNLFKDSFIIKDNSFITKAINILQTKTIFNTNNIYRISIQIKNFILKNKQIIFNYTDFYCFGFSFLIIAQKLIKSNRDTQLIKNFIETGLDYMIFFDIYHDEDEDEAFQMKFEKLIQNNFEERELNSFEDKFKFKDWFSIKSPSP